MGDLMAPCSSSLDFQQHLGIVGELLEEKEEAFHGLQGAVSGKTASDQIDLVEQVFGKKEFLSPGADLKISIAG